MLKFNAILNEETKEVESYTTSRVGLIYPHCIGKDENDRWHAVRREVFGFADRKLYAGLEDDELKLEAFESATTYEDETSCHSSMVFAIGLGWFSKQAEGYDKDVKMYPESMVGTITAMQDYARAFKADEEWTDERKQAFTNIKQALVDFFETVLDCDGLLAKGYELRIKSDRLNDVLSRVYTQKKNNGGKALTRGVQWVTANKEQVFAMICELMCATLGMVNYPKIKKQARALNW